MFFVCFFNCFCVIILCLCYRLFFYVSTNYNNDINKIVKMKYIKKKTQIKILTILPMNLLQDIPIKYSNCSPLCLTRRNAKTVWIAAPGLRATLTSCLTIRSKWRQVKSSHFYLIELCCIIYTRIFISDFFFFYYPFYPEWWTHYTVILSFLFFLFFLFFSFSSPCFLILFPFFLH